MIKKINTNTFVRFFFYISIPVCIAALIFIMYILYFINTNKTMLIDNYTSFLSNSHTNNEATLKNLAEPISNLSNNNTFIQVVTGKTENIDAISKTQYKLQEIEKNNTFIDSISVIIRSSEKKVITSDRMYDMTEYFEDIYVYDDYTYKYWNEYRFPSIEKRYLAPTQAYKKTTKESKFVIPLVFSKIDDVYMSNLVVVNIDFLKLLNTQNSTLPKSAIFGIINKYSQTFYTNNNNHSLTNDESFFKLTHSLQNSNFDYKINGKKHLVVTYSPKKSILGYTYATILPYSHINKNLWSILLFSSIMFIFALFLLAATTYYSTKKIYSPIKNLASVMCIDDEQDLIAQLHKAISDLAVNIKKPNKDSYTLTYEQEHLLVNMLNSPENSFISQLDECRVNGELNFENDYFCSIIINLKLSTEFYNVYNSVDYNVIITGLYNIIQNYFAEKFNTYILPSKTNTLYMILNLTENDSMDDINQIIKAITNILEFDSSYIYISFGVGGIYKDLVGLKKSHHKALCKVDLQETYTQVILHNISPDNTPACIFSLSDEEKLFNYLLTNKVQYATEMIDTIANLNIQNNVPDSSIMHMYTEIINTIFKALKTKHIDYDPENIGDYALVTEATSFSLMHARKYIRILLNYFSEQTTNSSSRVDINAIINYINSNFQKELFLDNIAETFGTTSKYLSKAIKTHLGVTFLTYLSTLRVNKAKELLKNEDKNINDIYQELGFSNRNAFTSAFKKIVGITPSEFKRLSNATKSKQE